MNTVVIILNSVFVPKQLITGVHGAVQGPAVAVARGGENVVPSTSKAEHSPSVCPMATLIGIIR